jgi:Ni/Co efflux regulator RcnB
MRIDGFQEHTMKIRPIVTAFAAGTLLLGNVAAYALAEAEQDAREHGYWAPDDPSRPRSRTEVRQQQLHNDQQRNDRYYHRDPRQDNRYDPRYYQRWDQDQRRYMPGDHFGNDWRGRGAGPSHDWYRGSYLPHQYNGRNYVVDDWRAHHLYAPPSGYHWVQSPGGDYVLAAIATGLIAAILLNQ